MLIHVRQNHLENEITDFFKIEYIRLLAHFHKRKVLQELQTGKYPPSECLTICEEQGIQLPVAYLKARLGYFNEALDIYKKRLKKNIKALLKGNRINDEEKAASLFKKMKSDGEMSLELCKESEKPEKVKFKNKSVYA